MSKEIKYAPILEQDERSFIFNHVKIYREEQITIHQQKIWELYFSVSLFWYRLKHLTINLFKYKKAAAKVQLLL